MDQHSVLVVDDERSIRLLLAAALRNASIDVVEAEDGAHAIEAAAQHGHFDLVVTDVMMPGMDGIELAEHLWNGRQAARFLFVSGYADVQEIGRRIHGFEASGFLAKPFSVTGLMTEVHRLLNQRVTAPLRARTARDARKPG